jgi:hypothetical protein
MCKSTEDGLKAFTARFAIVLGTFTAIGFVLLAIDKFVR